MLWEKEPDACGLGRQEERGSFGSHPSEASSSAPWLSVIWGWPGKPDALPGRGTEEPLGEGKDVYGDLRGLSPHSFKFQLSTERRVIGTLRTNWGTEALKMTNS